MTAAAAIAARSREAVVRHFTEATAFDPGSAIAYTPMRTDDRGAFDNLLRAEVVRSAAPGLYYLDQVALVQERLRWRRNILIALAVLAVALGGGVALGVFH